jgi:urease beta subunit
MNIVLDNASTFHSNAVAHCAIAKLDSTHVVIAFQDDADGDKGKVVVGSVDGTTITVALDSAVLFESGDCEYLSVAALDSTHFVIAFMDLTDGRKGKVIAGSVAGVAITITADSASVYDNAICMYMHIAALSSTHFVIAYRGNLNKGYVIAGSVAGVAITITADSGSIFENGDCRENSIAALSSTHFVIAFRDYGDGSKGKVIAGSVAGVAITITADSGSIFNTVASSSICIAVLSSTHFVIAFRIVAEGKVIAGSVAGVAITITADSASVFESSDYLTDVVIAVLDSTRFVITFSDYDDGYKGKAIAGKVSGTTITITLDSATTFESGWTNYGVVAALDSNYFVVAFEDDADLDKGKVIAGEYAGPFTYGLHPGAMANIIVLTIHK